MSGLLEKKVNFTFWQEQAHIASRIVMLFLGTIPNGVRQQQRLLTLVGGVKRPQFQNHAVSICEDSQGNYINLNEAHFICGIMNTPVAFEYVQKSSDSRSYPVRPCIYIPKYNKENMIHEKISNLSKEAHINFDNEQKIRKIMEELNDLYLIITKRNKQLNLFAMSTEGNDCTRK